MADPQENKDHGTKQEDTATHHNHAPEHKSTPDKATLQKIQEHGGPKGLEPTRYGDWESNGRCTDF